MMKKIVFTLLGLLFVIIANSQVSQDSAQTILKNHIANYDDFDIYVANNMIGISDTIQLLGSRIIVPPQDSCWMFFVDEMPLANWGHPCKYVFVKISSGKCDIIESQSPPFNLSINAVKRLPRPIYSNQDIFRIEKQRIQNTLEHNYAVIISGGARPKINFERYWYDCAAIYSLLVNKYGYDRNKIYVIMSDGTDPGNDRRLIVNPLRVEDRYDSSPLYLDGDTLPDIQYAATKTNISNVFDALSNIITPEDDVFIFTTDHGTHVNNQWTLSLWNNIEMTSEEFAAEVDKINNARAINILMQQCYSGGFLPELCGDNRVVMTACNNSEGSLPMSYPLYDEFCYHWISAMNGATLLGGVIVNADSNNDGCVSMKEAFNYAVDNDVQSEHPQYCSDGTQGECFSLDGIMPEHITADVTWNTPLDINNDIIVDAGKTLTITSTIRFAPNVIFDIKPGAKVVVDGGTLTNLTTGKMWNGIHVVGDDNQRQLAEYQGTLEVKNNAIIENAKCAIRTSGGIVRCSNSTFLNNGKCAEFVAYTNHTATGSETSNVSYFKNCNFSITDNNIFVAAGVTFSDMIKMSAVNGISIRGCHFSDTRTGSPTRGTAIYLAGAGVNIKPSCSYGDYTINMPCICMGESRNTFSGFTKGISVQNPGSNYTINVFKTDFALCEQGIYTSAVNNYNVTMSNFNLSGVEFLTPLDGFGIYSNNCSGYKVEANNFYTTNTSHVFCNTCGIHMQNSGNNANTIYRNTFEKLDDGIKSINNPGLQVSCNEFSDNFTCDIGNLGSIPSQGTSSVSAGNQFSSGVSNFTSNIALYYYHSGAQLSSNPYYPASTSNNITKIPNITANECESTICIVPIFPPINPPINPKSSPASDDITLYESLQQEYDSRLAEYDAAGYGFLLENFDEEDADIVALARLKQDTLITIHRAMAEIANRNIDAILQDTLVFDRESLNGWYNRINTQTAKYSLVNSYFEVGEYALARQELASIPQRFALTTDELAEYDNFCQYQSLRESVYASGRNYAQFTETEIAELQTIAERNTGVSSAYANSVLCFFYGICRDEELDLDFDIDAPMNSKSTTEVVEENAETLAIYVYPNPADEELNILLNSLPNGRTTIEFHDVTGRLVLSEEIKSNSTSINISSLRQGVYMYRIVNGDNVIARDRIVKE